MLQAWWIRRWYFLYISACIVLHVIALFKSFSLDLYTFTRITHFHKTSFYKNNLLYTTYFTWLFFNHT
ncbi:hypothetical protein HanRHA438_Chr17g0825841 [Helianthus annuus]|nr:hypothetical protein HanRHA438_Chr17g0825841 [Helianthus annuus]